MAKAILRGTPWYVYTSIMVALGLAITGMFIPPTGVIDGSVLKAIAEILGGVTLIEFVVNIPAYLEAGIKAKISHGDTAIVVASDEVEEEAEDL